MKVRNGFVSNSSSSSFIVFSRHSEIDQEAIEKLSSLLQRKTYSWDESKSYYELELPLVDGNKEFDGGFTEYTSFEDKINYISYQIIGRMTYKGRIDRKAQDMQEILEKAITKTLEGKLQSNFFYIRFDFNRGFHGGYIDHASVFPTMNWNDEVFYSVKAMQNFLFCKDSKIEDGNDYYTGPGEDDCPLPYARAYQYMRDNMEWFKDNLFETREQTIQRLQKELLRLKIDRINQECEKEAIKAQLRELGGTENVD